jgi:hypothetical protein
VQKEKLMGIDIDTIQHNHYLEVVVASSYDFQETIDKFPHVLDICRITGLKKVLIDYKEIQNQGCATEKSLYALSSQDLYQSYLKVGGHALQIAYVAPMVTNYERTCMAGSEKHITTVYTNPKRSESKLIYL